MNSLVFLVRVWDYEMSSLYIPVISFVETIDFVYFFQARYRRCLMATMRGFRQDRNIELVYHLRSNNRCVPNNIICCRRHFHFRLSICLVPPWSCCSTRTVSSSYIPIIYRHIYYIMYGCTLHPTPLRIVQSTIRKMQYFTRLRYFLSSSWCSVYTNEMRNRSSIVEIINGSSLLIYYYLRPLLLLLLYTGTDAYRHQRFRKTIINYTRLHYTYVHTL